jgi:hypothetical protein
MRDSFMEHLLNITCTRWALICSSERRMEAVWGGHRTLFWSTPLWASLDLHCTLSL